MSSPRSIGRREIRQVARRSVCLQAVWNYETLQSIGFAWALVPGLKRLYEDPAERGRRLAAFLAPFNSNPYLGSIGLGVALRLEQEVSRGSAGAAERLSRLLKAVRSPLGALGDDLFWAGWRPALGTLAAAVALGSRSTVAAVGFVVMYNALAQSVRWRGVRAGYASGAGIARVLDDPFWHRTARMARFGGAWVAGTILGIAAWEMAAGDALTASVFLIAAALLWLAGLLHRAGVRWLSPSVSFLAVIVTLSFMYRVLAEVGP